MESRIKRIALTGGIASGKSLAGNYLREKDIPVIDADDVVHQILREDAEVKDCIRQTFGEQVFNEDGTVNRPTLGMQVFADVAKRKQLESWIHPKTRERIEEFYLQHAHRPLAVSIIPLLFESNLEDRYDEVWLMETPEEVQIDRLMQTRHMSLEDVQARIRNQMPAHEKRARATRHPCHHFIVNSSSPEALYRQIDTLLGQSGL